MKKINSILLVLPALVLIGAGYSQVNPSGFQAVKVHEVPPGLQGDDLVNFEHLSEGSDIYPYEWMRALNTVTVKDSDGKFSTPFLERLDVRHGLIESDSRKLSNGREFLMPYKGLTAAWSGQRPEESDAFTEDQLQKVKESGRVKSIKMVGTNCSFCHSGELSYRGERFSIQGAPSITNVRGFFVDLAKSTTGILAKQELMEGFLRRLQVPEPEKRAEELNIYFYKRLGETTYTFINAGKWSAKLTLLKAKYLSDTRRFFNGKQAISDTLFKLLKLTYGFKDTDDLTELRARMNFLGTLMVGTDPNTKEVMSGYGRTDAFGRIGNLVLRGNDPIGYTGPVSLPWIWGLKYMAMLHYNGNSNSVTLRNMGQSLGLGAIVLNEKGDSTVNLYNLDRLERLVDKIQFPQWQKVFANVSELQINASVAQRGKTVYEQQCQTCHESNRFVGPRGLLREYNMYPLNQIGTDKNSAVNAVKAVGKKQFERSIFDGVGGLKARYYERWGISSEKQADLEFRELRGQEFFRDTLLGFKRQDEFANNYGNIDQGFGYKARSLSGVWATAPFLHNGSVPTLWDLLTPAKDRPKIFNIQKKEFDAVKVGLVSEREKNIFGGTKGCEKGDETCFDTSIAGNYNSGHEFGTHLSDGDKKALIEYLKILPPEPEYSWESSEKSW